MVNDEVSVKNPFNYKKLLFWILIILLVVVIVFIIFVLLSIYTDMKLSDSSQTIGEDNIVNPAKKDIHEANFTSFEEEEAIQEAVINFDKSYINYMLIAIGANKLHNPPFSSNTPKIKSVVDGEVYWSEVVDGKISTYEGDIEDPDLLITTTKQVAVQAMLSYDLSKYMKDAVWEGTITVEMLAGKVELATKGYLEMYNNLYG